MDEDATQAQLELQYPHMLPITSARHYQRLPETGLWRMYWEVGKFKVWAYAVRLAISTRRFKIKQWEFISRQWGENEAGLVWDPSHVVYY